MARIEKELAECRLTIVNVRIEKNRQGQEVSFEFDVKFATRQREAVLTDRIAAISGVKKVRLE